MITRLKLLQYVLNAEYLINKHTNLDIVIYSLKIYHSLVHTHTHFFRLTCKVTYSYGFNSTTWETEISKPSWVSKPPF